MGRGVGPLSVACRKRGEGLRVFAGEGDGEEAWDFSTVWGTGRRNKGCGCGSPAHSPTTLPLPLPPTAKGSETRLSKVQQHLRLAGLPPPHLCRAPKPASPRFSST